MTDIKKIHLAPALNDEVADPAQRRQTFIAIGLYLAVAFAMAWLFWLVGILIAHGKVSLPLLPIMIIGSFGPLVGALVTTLATGGGREAFKFFARGFDPRMGWAVFLVSFFLLPLLAILGEFIHARITDVAPHIRMHWSDLPASYLFLFILGGTLAEEYGWSFLSDKLDRLVQLKQATLLLGIVWAVWHLPLFFIVTPHAVQGYTPFHIFLIATVALRFLFAWAYHRGGRNILSNMLFHTASNMAYSIVALAPSPEDMTTGRLWVFAALNIICAIVLWMVAPPESRVNLKGCGGSSAQGNR